MTADELARAVGAEAAAELTAALAKIKHCQGQLNDEQIWWRSHPALNSIGNLILHLAGNLRQWIVAGIGGAADVRNLPAEFAQSGAITNCELLARIESVVDQAKARTARMKLRITPFYWGCPAGRRGECKAHAAAPFVPASRSILPALTCFSVSIIVLVSRPDRSARGLLNICWASPSSRRAPRSRISPASCSM